MIRWMPALLLAFALLAGCAADDAPSPVRPSVAADAQSSEGGIGGTGAPPKDLRIAGEDEAEGGIGGTGIFGTITRFGSIVVNGLTIDLDDAVIEPAGEAVGQDLPLTVGSAVLVEAGRSGDGLAARRVALFLPLVGPIERVDPVDGTIRVMGTTVEVDPDAVFFDRADRTAQPLPSLGLIGPGDRVAVNGIWNGETVVAGRIDRLADGERALLRGLLLEGDDGYRIGGTTLGKDCCGDLATPAFVHVEGRYAEDRFDAEAVVTGADLLFSAGLEALIVEAFLARDPDGEGFHLSGFGIPADQSANIVAEPGVRSLFIGDYDEAFRIERSMALPDDQESRIEALQSLGDIIP